MLRLTWARSSCRMPFHLEAKREELTDTCPLSLKSMTVKLRSFWGWRARAPAANVALSRLENPSQHPHKESIISLQSRRRLHLLSCLRHLNRTRAALTSQGWTEAHNEGNTLSGILIWMSSSVHNKKTSPNRRFHNRKSCVTLWKTQANAAVISLAVVTISRTSALTPVAHPVQTSLAMFLVSTPSHPSKAIIFENLRNIFWSHDSKAKKTSETPGESKKSHNSQSAPRPRYFLILI